MEAFLQWVVSPVLIGVLAILQVRQSRKLGRVEKSSAATAEQVTNSHPTNLRDDLTEVSKIVTEGFADMKRKFVRTEEQHEEVTRDIKGLREEIGQIRKVEREQWDAIESTQPRPRVTGRPRRKR